jgi:hypothetical protein
MQAATKVWLAVAVIVASLPPLIAFAAARSARLNAVSEETARSINARVTPASSPAGLTEANAARTFAMILRSIPGSKAVWRKTSRPPLHASPRGRNPLRSWR